MVNTSRDPRLLRRVETSSRPPAPSLSDQELHILHCALRCFGRNGFAATSVRSIAAEAGVTGPMINYYFEGKEHLYRRLIDIVSDAMQAKIERVAAAPGPLRERLGRAMHAFIEFAVESPDAVALFFGAAYGPTEGRPDLDAGAMRDRGLAQIEALIVESVGSGSFRLRTDYATEDLLGLCEAALLKAIGREVTSGWQEDPTRGDRLKAELDRSLRVILDGIEARSETTS